MKHKLNKSILIWGFLFALAAFPFQNCTQSKFSHEAADLNKILSPGNGGPYGGKPGTYRFYSSNIPCQKLDAAGHALPNDIILVKQDQQGELAPFLSRKTCVDIEPQRLSMDAVQYNAASNSLVYQNQSFSPESRSGEFDIVAASCPVGKTVIPNALRTNIFSSPFDWTVPQFLQGNLWTAGWYRFDGIGVSLDSTIESLPAFLVQRNDSTALDYWRRISQHINLKPNTDYSFTFLARPASTKSAQFTFYREAAGVPSNPANEEAVITFDFQSGSATTDWITNVANVKAVISPFGNGFLCTVFFTTSATGDQSVSNIGITPSAAGQSFGQMGDSILATAAQLLPVDEYCR